MPEQTLAELRASIDRIDHQIVDLLASRFAATEQVGKLKVAEGLAAVDKAREIQQQEQYRQLAIANGLNPDLVLHIFRLVIDEVVANHRKVAQVAGR